MMQACGLLGSEARLWSRSFRSSWVASILVGLLLSCLVMLSYPLNKRISNFPHGWRGSDSQVGIIRNVFCSSCPNTLPSVGWLLDFGVWSLYLPLPMSVIRWSSILISREGAGGLPHVGLGAIWGSCIWFCKNWKTFDDLGVEVEGCVGHRRVMTQGGRPVTRLLPPSA